LLVMLWCLLFTIFIIITSQPAGWFHNNRVGLNSLFLTTTTPTTQLHLELLDFPTLPSLGIPAVGWDFFRHPKKTVHSSTPSILPKLHASGRHRGTTRQNQTEDHPTKRKVTLLSRTSPGDKPGSDMLLHVLQALLLSTACARPSPVANSLDHVHRAVRATVTHATCKDNNNKNNDPKKDHRKLRK
jgi:hypothetical protein